MPRCSSSAGPARWLRQGIALGAALLLTALGCEGRQRGPLPADEETRSSAFEPHVAEIDLRRGAPEQAGGALFAAAEERSFAHLVLELRELAANEELRGLFVRLGTARWSLARAHEAGRMLAALRSKGLPVVCHADTYHNGSMLLAAAGCSEIWLSPAGTLDTVGLAAQLVFGRSLLEKLSIRADFLQAGDAKGAIEPFTRDSASPEARESLRSTLDALRQAWLAGLATGRAKEAAELGAEDGPHTAPEALTRGLIDQVGYDEDARDAALRRAEVDNLVVAFGRPESDEPSVAELIRILSGTGSRAAERVALLRATGAITMTGGSLFGGSDGISARSLIRELRRLEGDEQVRAVVLRIDSPGGSSLASDLLWKELMRLRERKPLVVSIGAMAASGGTYLACAGHEVWAERTSIVGSIGVMGGKLSFADSLEQLGVTVETVTPTDDAGDRALFGSPLAAWDDATRTRMRELIDYTYELFLERVAEGRGTSVEAVEPAADGQIFGGTRGRELGLVDELGGLNDAIDAALRRAELPADADVEIVAPPSGLLSLLGVEGAEGRRQATARLERRAARATMDVLAGPLAPYRDEVLVYVDSMTPLLRQERMLVALPFVLALR